jgi:hypothetical protein
MITAVVVSLFSATAFAGDGGTGELIVPGWGSASGGSKGSSVKNSTIIVSGNRSTGTVTAVGGEASGYGVTVGMPGTANVNSVNINTSTVKNSTIGVMDNQSKDVNAIGGTANVNSVNIN